MKKLFLVLPLLLVYSWAAAQNYKPVAKDFASEVNFDLYMYLYEMRAAYEQMKSREQIPGSVQDKFEAILVLPQNSQDQETFTSCKGAVDPWTFTCTSPLIQGGSKSADDDDDSDDDDDGDDDDDVIIDPWAPGDDGDVINPWPNQSKAGQSLMKSLEAVLPAKMVKQMQSIVPGYSVGAIMMKTEKYLKRIKRN